MNAGLDLSGTKLSTVIHTHYEGNEGFGFDRDGIFLAHLCFCCLLKELYFLLRLGRHTLGVAGFCGRC
jgi:hypothetical protein